MALVQRRSAAAASERTASRRTAAPADDEEPDDEPRRPARRPAAKPTFRSPARDEDDDGVVDEDDAPRSRRGSSGPASDAVQSGWGAAKKLKQEGGDFADEMSITNDPQLVKFLSDAPYAVYKQHWVEGLRSTKKKSFICLGKGCPLCNLGESAAKKWAFNVAVFDGDDVEVKSLIAGSRLFDNIADEHEGSDGPLDEGYWTLSKSGKKQSTTYKLKKIEGRKLEADWGVTETDLDDILADADPEPYTAAQHQPPSRSYLQEIADEIGGEAD
jgi:hypothetical protein